MEQQIFRASPTVIFTWILMFSGRSWSLLRYHQLCITYASLLCFRDDVYLCRKSEQSGMFPLRSGSRSMFVLSCRWSLFAGRSESIEWLLLYLSSVSFRWTMSVQYRIICLLHLMPSMSETFSSSSRWNDGLCKSLNYFLTSSSRMVYWLTSLISIERMYMTLFVDLELSLWCRWTKKRIDVEQTSRSSSSSVWCSTREARIGDWTIYYSSSSALLSSLVHFCLRSRLSKLGFVLFSLLPTRFRSDHNGRASSCTSRLRRSISTSGAKQEQVDDLSKDSILLSIGSLTFFFIACISTSDQLTRSSRIRLKTFSSAKNSNGSRRNSSSLEKIIGRTRWSWALPRSLSSNIFDDLKKEKRNHSVLICSVVAIFCWLIQVSLFALSLGSCSLGRDLSSDWINDPSVHSLPHWALFHSMNLSENSVLFSNEIFLFTHWSRDENNQHHFDDQTKDSSRLFLFPCGNDVLNLWLVSKVWTWDMSVE